MSFCLKQAPPLEFCPYLSHTHQTPWLPMVLSCQALKSTVRIWDSPYQKGETHVFPSWVRKIPALPYCVSSLWVSIPTHPAASLLTFLVTNVPGGLSRNKKVSETSWTSYDLTQFLYSLPGDSVRANREGPSPTELPPIHPQLQTITNPGFHLCLWPTSCGWKVPNTPPSSGWLIC